MTFTQLEELKKRNQMKYRAYVHNENIEVVTYASFKLKKDLVSFVKKQTKLGFSVMCLELNKTENIYKAFQL